MVFLLLHINTSERFSEILELLLKIEPIDYATPNHFLQDFLVGDLYAVVDSEDSNIKAIGTLFYDDTFQLSYIKRVVSFHRGSGYAKEIIRELASLRERVAITPFIDNHQMIKIVESLGFEFKYTFLDNYAFYIKE